ncbi:MAG: hypothetical protein ACYDDO_07220 [Acidiferrobacterales bacterium]
MSIEFLLKRLPVYCVQRRSYLETSALQDNRERKARGARFATTRKA